MRFAAQAAAAHAAAAAAAARGQPPTAATSSNVPPPPTNGQDRQAVERGGSEGFNGNGDAAASSDGNNPNQGLLNVGIPNILRAALTGSRDVRVLKIETLILMSLDFENNAKNSVIFYGKWQYFIQISITNYLICDL